MANAKAASARKAVQNIGIGTFFTHKTIDQAVVFAGWTGVPPEAKTNSKVLYSQTKGNMIWLVDSNHHESPASSKTNFLL